MSSRRKARPFANQRPTSSAGAVSNQPRQIPTGMPGGVSPYSLAPGVEHIPGFDVGGGIPVGPAPGIRAQAVKLFAEYGADLPEQGFTPFYRTISFAATDITGLPVGGFVDKTLEDVPTGVGLLIFNAKYQWLESGTDPFDPNALAAMQDDQAINGTITVDMVVDGAPVVDQQSTLYDPSTSASTRVRGFARLNDNVLVFGNSPSVIYVKQSSVLGARFYHNRTPGNPPEAILFQVAGYSCPSKLLDGLIRRTRSSN